MSAPELDKRKPSAWRWGTPAVAVAIGVVYLVVGLMGDEPGFAWFGLLLMLALAVAIVVLARFSETVAGLLDRRDERINRIDTSSTTVAGMAVITAVLIGFAIEVAQGRDGSPYAALGAIGAVAYVVSLVVLRFRR